MRPKVDQRAGLLSLAHVGITKTKKKIELKHNKPMSKCIVSNSI